MAMSESTIIDLVKLDLRVNLDGIHGYSHWERVCRIGSVLSARTGADLDVVKAFAWVHDARRWTDGRDSRHGQRGAKFARDVNDQALHLTAEQLEILCTACTHHSREGVAKDPTIGTCWDADRLDLARLGIEPDPGLLSTLAARDGEFISWACGLSGEEYEHAFLVEEE